MDRLQSDFPITQQPFADVAAELGLTEDELIDRIDGLLSADTASRFGPLYNVERMGGAFMLCALSAPEAEFDQIAAVVNSFPEVAHNYAREHGLNMWFVLAAETPQRIDEVTREIETASGCQVYSFPKEEEFCVHLRLKP
ncbi:MAG: Lrp/AsnC family transcriptional regulator [Gammaproteobacteria bacterium]|nr:Lrp/AsnC family transcriptional regulator [Gammaproteobacteria bacterium]